MCVSTDVMFSIDEITDRDIGTQMTTGTPAHREYKRRPGHSKRKRHGHKECSISNHYQQTTGTQITTIWRVTTYARGGAWGGEAPPSTRCWGGAKRHPNS